MKKITLLTFTFLFLTSFIYAQGKQFKAKEVTSSTKKSNFNPHFNSFKVFDFESDVKSFNQHLESPDFENQISLNFGDVHNWDILLYENDMRSDDYVIRTATENGIEEFPKIEVKTFYGYLNNNLNSDVRLTVSGNFVYGFIRDGEETYYIEPAQRFQKNSNLASLVVYKSADVKAGTGTCAVTDTKQKIDKLKEQKNPQKNPTNNFLGNCYTVELAIAADYSYYLDRGSDVGLATAYIIGVMNNVANNYELNGSTNFDDGIEFEIVEQFISVCAECDPWSASTDPSILLSSFRTWGNAGGFNSTYDLAQHWTNRDFDGTTIGLAYRSTGVVCGNSRYHVLQDFSTNANSLRVLTAHEIGHNFNGVHDASGAGTIMAPSVNNTNTWSATSQTDLSAEILVAAGSCLANCAAVVCDPLTGVDISNITTTGFDLTWDASASGNVRIRVREEGAATYYTTTASGVTSMTVSPPGFGECTKYEALIENDCGGSFSAPVTMLFWNAVNGCADFSVDKNISWISGATFNFTDLSTNANSSWSWNFGDGNTSTAQNPSHTYTTGGDFTVTLSVNSGNNTMTKTNLIHVVPNKSVPYTPADGGNFTTNSGDFGTEDLVDDSSIWERGLPSFYFTNTTDAWVTDLDANVPQATTASVLYSPNFDFSGAGTYSLKFDLAMQRLFSNAPYGLQVEYSTDEGGNWTRLGSDADPGWYNRGPSSSGVIHPAIFADEMGFLNTATWNIDYEVSSLAGNNNVTFRFYFAANGGFSASGFLAGAMLDNFEVDFFAALPIELLTFRGKQQDESILLNWKTASEIDNDFFTLEHSSDGVNFEYLGEIDGKGNSNNINDYRFVHPDPTVGTNYYRLSQTDYDGTSKIADVIAVDFKSDKVVAAVVPNPVREYEINLQYISPQNANVEIEVVDMTGKVLIQSTVLVSEGENNIQLPIGNWSAGVYYLRTIQNQTIKSIKFVKTK